MQTPPRRTVLTEPSSVRCCARCSAGTSASHRVAEVQRAPALDHDWVLEHHVIADELTEVADAAAEQDRHLADAELVDEAEIQSLLDDVGAGDRDEHVAGDVLC